MPDAEWQQYSGTLFLKRNSRKFGNEKKIEQKKVHYLGNSVLYIKHFDGRTLDMEQNTNKAKWRMKADKTSAIHYGRLPKKNPTKLFIN